MSAVTTFFITLAGIALVYLVVWVVKLTARVADLEQRSSERTRVMIHLQDELRYLRERVVSNETDLKGFLQEREPGPSQPAQEPARTFFEHLTGE